jgi:aspartyl-tRNA(Asn)/glutamyl-tRNA(Gln) amidotransferase subunit C
MAASEEALSIEEVRGVAHLARLALTPAEEEKFSRQLGQILGYVKRLQAVDLTGVEPMAHAVPLAAPERADVVRPSLSREDVLRNAPQRVGEGIAVPKIIE